jgi:hypothetical protein
MENVTLSSQSSDGSTAAVVDVQNALICVIGQGGAGQLPVTYPSSQNLQQTNNESLRDARRIRSMRSIFHDMRR